MNHADHDIDNIPGWGDTVAWTGPDRIVHHGTVRIVAGDRVRVDPLGEAGGTVDLDPDGLVVVERAWPYTVRVTPTGDGDGDGEVTVIDFAGTTVLREWLDVAADLAAADGLLTASGWWSQDGSWTPDDAGGWSARARACRAW